MSRLSAIDESRLTVLLDVRQPQAYLALNPVVAFAAERGVEINWLPVVVYPLKAPTPPGPDDDRGVRHRRHRAHAIARELETYAAAQGLVLRELYRDDDPSAFNLAWLWLREQQPERLFDFLAEGFRAWWACELDVSSLDAVRTLLDRCGIAPAGFAAWVDEHGRMQADALAGELRERGISGAPAYLVGDEFFVGRQHLPMIGWILDGRSGPGPI